MSDSRTAASTGRFEVRTTSDSHFGWIRTRLSVERTMMSWQRTAVALIGFGFAIVQYFNHLQQIPGARPAYFPTAPEYLGLALISSISKSTTGPSATFRVNHQLGHRTAKRASYMTEWTLCSLLLRIPRAGTAITTPTP